jgi:tetratricopeptide (TPR) repeat protein
MRADHVAWLLLPALLAGCAQSPDRHTLGELRRVEPDVADVRVDDGLDQAIRGYRDFLEETPESELTPDAMRRLADLKVEKEYGILGDGEIRELPAPAAGEQPSATSAATPAAVGQDDGARASGESDEAFERRTTRPHGYAQSGPELPMDLPEEGTAAALAEAGPMEAIALYDQILAAYPHYRSNDQVLYQKARAYDELGRPDDAMNVMERLVREYPNSRYLDEIQFRRAEYFFMRKQYLDAEYAYAAIIGMGEGSEYYELALYKLGWTLYKQDLYEDALHKYMALLDYKVSIGYDFDQSGEEAEERRVADTYRVISLSFSILGGPEAVEEYFAANGQRSYEDRIYSHLGEFYYEKLRYNDAARTYQAFIDLYPLHRTAPHFSMRMVEIYEAGGFPRLVLETKKGFAERYGVSSEYWQHFALEERPEVRSYLKSNLEDLASHYHALYQEEELVEEQPANYAEARHWYDEYLVSFPEDLETPDINYRLADLLLENEDFGAAALSYERTAYDYAPHERAAAAGYAAIYAHREHQKVAVGAEQAIVRGDAVTSTLRFVDAFPAHEHADVVLGAAVDDLYDMEQFEAAIENGHKLIANYPDADPDIRRSAWLVVAHASFDTARYVEAEDAYLRVLAVTPEDDESHAGIVDNLAASIYKQGEQANVLEDYRTAANHFLRIRQLAPTSSIRPAAEYDAGAALMRLEDWAMAASVLDAFRQTYPEHELNKDATRQIAHVYREDGQISRAAEEYERVAEEAEDPVLRAESLLLAGELYEETDLGENALSVYLRYVEEFPEPIDVAVETRYKVAGMQRDAYDIEAYHEQLERIVEIDDAAGDERTPRIRYLAAQSALVLAEVRFRQFAAVELVQPFDQSLQLKQAQMDETVAALERLVDYEVAEVTAAATFYMAEVYFDFSRSLMESERPTDLSAAELLDYEGVLEEEAWPFEERAIEVHEKNLELMVAGHFNPWIKKSLGQLADLMPGRYAKFEESSGFIGSIDTYAYRSPAAGRIGLDEGATDSPPAEAGDPTGTPTEEPTEEPSTDDGGPETVATG